MQTAMFRTGPIRRFLGSLSLGTIVLAGILGIVVFAFATALIGSSDDPSGIPVYAFGLLLPLSVPAYLIVQMIVLLRSSGFGRLAAALPLVVMVPIFVQAAIALAHESNLWFLNLYLASPVALSYVVVAAFFVRPAGKPSPPAT